MAHAEATRVDEIEARDGDRDEREGDVLTGVGAGESGGTSVASSAAGCGASVMSLTAASLVTPPLRGKRWRVCCDITL